MLCVKNVDFYYETKLILEDISFSVNPGEYVAILGESGCGKSTLLEILYGLFDLSKGSITYNDTILRGPKFNIIPGHPFMKYLAQDFSLMPFTTVGENVGEFLSNIYKDLKQQRIVELLEVVDMLAYKDVKVKNLSGGQKQRVAIARVLAKEPEVLLLDEPFSHIDNFRKNHLRRKLFSYLKSKNITCIVATHDSTDALSFADEILMIQNHQIIRKDNPKNIYNNPITEYVGSFFNEINKVIDNNGEEILFYPENVLLDESSNNKFLPIHNYYKGNCHFTLGWYLHQQIIIKSNRSLSLDKPIGITIIPLPKTQ